MPNCNALLRPKILDQFDGQLQIDENQGDCRVVFPFRRLDGDPIILYVVEEKDHFVISDEGETHGMLLTSGVDIDTEKRENRVDSARERFNLIEAEKEIRLTATEENIGQRLLDAYQAVQWISFLVYTRRPYSPSYFKDKVASFLRKHQFRFEEDRPVQAESEDQTVDFTITNQPRPVYLQSIQARNATDLKEKSNDTSFKWIKISRAQPNVRFVTVVDDDDGIYEKEHMRALFDDSDAVIPWTNRDDLPMAITG